MDTIPMVVYAAHNTPHFLRYYSIPAEVATEPAVVNLMQRGKKLHVHLEHMLVASKSRGFVIFHLNVLELTAHHPAYIIFFFF